MPGEETYVQYANSAYFITKLFFYIIMANSLNSIDFTTINYLKSKHLFNMPIELHLM
jgi:hypothetical protein